jgi:allophanate hydrolase
MSKVVYPKRLSIKWLKEMYGSNRITPEEVILEIINRANKYKDMNIWITAPEFENINSYIEKLKLTEPNSLPLWGIPFAIKDNIDLENIQTTAGCPEYAYTPRESAEVVKKLIQAGAIPIGKTNLDQFATGLVGTRSPYGEVHNALKSELISGGSSSGSAVSVATGQVSFSLGTDTAGSGRVPALLNDIVGFKTSCGAWSTKGLTKACASLDCITVFSLDLEEAIMVDDVVRGFVEEDFWSKEIPKPISKLPKKICIPNKPPEFYGPYGNDYEKAWNKAIKKINELRIPIDYIDYEIFSEAATILYDGPWIAERWKELGEFVKGNPDKVFPVTKTILEGGGNPKFDAVSVFKAIHKLQELKAKVKVMLKDSVLIMPTAGGTWTRDQVRENPIATNSDMGKYTNHCNLLDLSALAIPSGYATDNVPFGITIFSLSDAEGLLLGIGKEFENKGKEKITVAVCGLHMQGYPLEAQMIECKSEFLRVCKTAEKYKLFKLNTNPAKPGLIKVKSGGKAIEVELWEMPLDKFGYFTSLIPSPLAMGKVELEDGSEVCGFICEEHGKERAEDITMTGGWRKL